MPFDVVSLQNNHALDLGSQGLQETLHSLNERNVIALGGSSYSTIVQSQNGNIGIIAVTDVVNASGDRKHVTEADSEDVLSEIRRLKQQVTLLAVYIHWGRELDPVPTRRMKNLASKYIRAGADLIVGTHPHVFGNVECIDGKPVVFSLGNFLFDQKYAETKKGAILDCTVNEESKLACTLVGHETSSNSYLPKLVDGESYREENEVLASCTPAVERTWTGLFTKDGKVKRLMQKKESPSSLLSHIEMYDLESGRREDKTPPMPIVKIQPVDLNADGIEELLLLQNIYSSIDKEVAKRVYIYSLNRKFHALWRGSALSRPLVDVTFVRRKNERPVLVALHTPDSFLVRKQEQYRRIVMSYRWNGFGFDGIRQRSIEGAFDTILYSKSKLSLCRQGTVSAQMSIEELE